MITEKMQVFYSLHSNVATVKVFELIAPTKWYSEIMPVIDVKDACFQGVLHLEFLCKGYKRFVHWKIINAKLLCSSYIKLLTKSTRKNLLGKVFHIQNRFEATPWIFKILSILVWFKSKRMSRHKYTPHHLKLSIAFTDYFTRSFYVSDVSLYRLIFFHYNFNKFFISVNFFSLFMLIRWLFTIVIGL